MAAAILKCGFWAVCSAALAAALALTAPLGNPNASGGQDKVYFIVTAAAGLDRLTRKIDVRIVDMRGGFSGLDGYLIATSGDLNARDVYRAGAYVVLRADAPSCGAVGSVADERLAALPSRKERAATAEPKTLNERKVL